MFSSQLSLGSRKCRSSYWDHIEKGSREEKVHHYFYHSSCEVRLDIPSAAGQLINFYLSLLRCIGRLILVVKYKNRISTCPAIEHLDRKNLSNHRRPNAVALNELQPELNSVDTSITLKLKRSGKVIRKVAQAPPLYSRTFRAPDLAADDRFGIYNHKAIKNAELVYILKPMIHLGAVSAFGYTSWKSYLLSLFLDVFR